MLATAEGRQHYRFAQLSFHRIIAERDEYTSFLIKKYKHARFQTFGL